MVFKNDFGYNINLSIVSNDISVDLTSADNIYAYIVSNNTEQVITREAIYNEETELYEVPILEGDFTIVDDYRVFLVFQYLESEVVIKKLTAYMGVLQVV